MSRLILSVGSSFGSWTSPQTIVQVLHSFRLQLETALVAVAAAGKSVENRIAAEREVVAHRSTACGVVQVELGVAAELACS